MSARKFRVSAFTPGTEISDAPRVHTASRDEHVARGHFFRLRKGLVSGKYGRIILHIGNLKHRSYKILCEASSWTHADQLTFELTAFPNFLALISAVAYWPSLNVRKPGAKKLANLYDTTQARRGSTRRAERYHW